MERAMKDGLMATLASVCSYIHACSHGINTYVTAMLHPVWLGPDLSMCTGVTYSFHMSYVLIHSTSSPDCVSVAIMQSMMLIRL